MKVLYIGMAKKNSSVDGVYIKGLRKNGVEVYDYSFHGKTGIEIYGELFKLFRKHKEGIDFVMVGYDSPRLIIFLWLFCRKKIIYNALCSVYERLIVSRNLARRLSLKAYYYWLIDYLACFASSLIMVESEHQAEYFQKLFKVPKQKLLHAWIGVDDELFVYKDGTQKYKEFTVLFRGRLLPEAGGDVAVRSAKILENYPIQFLMLANGFELPKIQKLADELKPKNLKIITEFLPDGALLDIMQKSHLSLGQLSDHERLERTIPHKAYESIALKLPYLTARNFGIMELLKEGETCLAFTPADAKDLAEKIIWSYQHQKVLDKIADNGYALFRDKLTTDLLGKALFERMKEL